ncbi:NTCP protein, partial [Edolisoma coerulescens]|nr:NTCP protein [Edolisoma coerulescens]
SPGCTQSSTSLSSVAPPFAFGQQAADTALNVILIVVLLINMMSLGCTMEIAKITAHLRRPKGVAIAIMAQYSIMPLTAFILGKLFQLGTSESLAVLICGCCPAGNLSNIFSLALKEDMNLRAQDIHLTTSMVKIIFCFNPRRSPPSFPGRQHVAMPKKQAACAARAVILHIDQKGIGLFKVSLSNSPGWSLAGMVMLLLSSAAVIVLSVANMGSCIMDVFAPSLLGSSALMPITGFLLGYAVSAAFKLDDRCRRTVCMETGCQNIQLCSAILKVAFAPEGIGPLYLFPLLYLLFQLGEGFLLILVFQIHDRRKPMAST